MNEIEIRNMIYLTYLREIAKLGGEAISESEFDNALQRSKKYIKKMYKMSKRTLSKEGSSHPYAIVPIDGTLYLLAQLNNGVVDIGVHGAIQINKILGEELIQVS